MKLSTKLILLFAVSSLVPLIIIGSLASYLSSRALNQQISGQINGVADRQTNRLQTLNDRNQEILGSLGSKLRLKLLLQSYKENPSAATVAEITSIISDYRAENSTLRSVTILDTKGRAVSSTNPNYIDKNYAINPLFTLIQSGQPELRFSVNEAGKTELNLGSSLNISNELVGYVVINSEVNRYLDIVQDYQQLGTTGEVAIVAKDSTGHYRFQLPVRFDNSSYMKPANSVAITQLLGRESTILETFKDYRGMEVLGTARQLPDTNWKVLVKIDKSEVLSPVFMLQKFTIYTMLGVLTLSILLAIYFSRRITRPLQRFAEVARKIQDGDLSQRVKVNGTDELGILGAAFNNMTNHLVQSSATLNASIMGLTQGFMIVERNGTIITVNEAALSLLGKHHKSGELSNFSDAMDDISGADWDVQLKKCINTGKVLIFKNATHKGSSLYVYMSPVVANKKVFGAAIQIMDLTEEKIMQRSRDEFFSIASHELRTPLTAIRGNAGMIKSFFADKLKSDDFNEMVDDIHVSSIRLIEIVNDFLDASSLEQGKIKYEFTSFPIQDVIKEVVYENTTNAATKSVKLIAADNTKGMPDVYADRNRVKQIIYNLIGNALKFTEKGSITISAVAHGKELKILVTDTGGGISEVNQKLLFHKFQQASTSLYTRDAARGTGLGLYISRLLTHQMGGKLELERSQTGVGTTFYFTIPLAGKTKELSLHS